MKQSTKSVSNKSSVNGAPKAERLHKLLSLEGEEFVRAAYRSILLRDPDESGKAHYLRQLRGTHSKIRILEEIRSSAEGSRYRSRVAGLDLMIYFYRLARMCRLPGPSGIPGKEGVKLESDTAVKSSVQYEENPLRPLNEVVRIVRQPTLVTDEASEPKKNPEKGREQVLWFDLSGIIESCGTVNGTVRTELYLASGLVQLAPNIRFALKAEGGYAEVTREQLGWLNTNGSVVDEYITFFGGQKHDSGDDSVNFVPQKHRLTVYVPKSGVLYFPFSGNDIVISTVWNDGEREGILSKIKLENPSIVLGQVVHDTYLLLDEATSPAPKEARSRFAKHTKWIFNVCDFALTFSEHAVEDLGKVQVEMNWPALPCIVVPRGMYMKDNPFAFDEADVLAKFEVGTSFALVVGTLAAHENFDTIYRACRMALLKEPDTFGKVFLCAEISENSSDLIEILARDPVMKDRVLQISTTARELQILLRRCQFVILPAASQSTQDILVKCIANGKVTIAADVASFRSIATDTVRLISPFDVKTWASAMSHQFAEGRRGALKQVQDMPKKIEWSDSVEQMLGQIELLPRRRESRKTPPQIWFDLSTSYLYWEGGVAGIIRTELTFAKYLYELVSHEYSIHFFAWSHNNFFEVAPERLQWLFESDDLVRDYGWFHDYWKNHSVKRDPFYAGDPAEDDPRVIRKFPDNSIVLFTCIDWNMYQSRVKAAVSMKAAGNNILLSQLMYDMTPFLVPHLHAAATCEGYIPFVEYVSNNFDHLIFGGKTSMRDAIQIQKEQGWGSPRSDYIEFGSDIRPGKATAVDRDVLDKYGVTAPFVLTVGTLEPRKNHEMLYRAYLHMMSLGKGKEMPMLVIVGKKGWRIDDFLNLLKADERISGKIVIVSPSDLELDVLYRNCLFTALASFYEGWSLTLPESLSYGKFCLTSSAEPLVETGRDLVEYIDPLDTAEWGRRIHFYSSNLSALRAREAYIAKNWNPKSWRDATKSLMKLVYAAHETSFGKLESNTP